MSKSIYPMAFKLRPNHYETLYYLGFPQEWKTELLKIAKTENAKWNDRQNLPTGSLKNLIVGWMDGAVSITALSAASDDECWLTSCYPITEDHFKPLCGIIKTWLRATYVHEVKTDDKERLRKEAVNDLVESFCKKMEPAALHGLLSRKEVCLTNEDGTVSGEAYPVVPLLIVNALLGKEISLFGQTLHLSYSGTNELMTEPVTVPGNSHQYSIVVHFSIQTHPPLRRALLHFTPSTRRWIYDTKEDGEKLIPYVNPAINGHIKVADDKYCKVGISYSYKNNRPEWKQQDKNCYDLFSFKSLPDAVDVLKDPLAYKEPGKEHPAILLPYSNGRYSFEKARVGTGITLLDKEALRHTLAVRLADYVLDEMIEAVRVKPPKCRTEDGKLLPCDFSLYDSPAEYPSRAAFRDWVHTCVGAGKITFELYGLWDDIGKKETEQHVSGKMEIETYVSEQKLILHMLEDKLNEDFGPNSPDSELEIQIVHKSSSGLLGKFEPVLKDGKLNKRATRIDNVARLMKEIGPSEGVTACLFVIPDRSSYNDNTPETMDPKNCLRNAFARTGRVVQFINPSVDPENAEKIAHCVYDLYRQLGIVSLVDMNKLPAKANVPCIGMYVCKKVKGRHYTLGGVSKCLTMPLYVTVNIPKGETFVECDAFPEYGKKYTYREACIEMAKLFWDKDIKHNCEEASFDSARRKLIDLKNEYDKPENPVAFIAAADANTRTLFAGLSDVEISKMEMDKPYCPKSINAGTFRSPKAVYMKDSGVRLIRFRGNQEVPDYFTNQSRFATEDKPQLETSSGVFKYEDVFWAIQTRPYSKAYIRSTKESRISHPSGFYSEKGMVELYPVQMQPGDNESEWVFYINALRKVSTQYDLETVLPLPLHLGKILEEYLFDPD